MQIKVKGLEVTESVDGRFVVAIEWNGNRYEKTFASADALKEFCNVDLATVDDAMRIALGGWRCQDDSMVNPASNFVGKTFMVDTCGNPTLGIGSNFRLVWARSLIDLGL